MNMPQNIEAEKTILGGLLVAGRARMPEVADIVTPADFHHPTHAAIFSMMLDLDEEELPIDSLSVGQRLDVKDQGHKLRSLGGPAYFSELMNAVVTVENLPYYARLIRDCADRRRVMEACVEVRLLIGRGDDGWRDEAESVLFPLLQERARRRAARVDHVVANVILEIEERYRNPTGLRGVTTGLDDLDSLTTGLQRGELCVLAARPSMGKTALALHIAYSAASVQAAPVLIFSLEMSRESLAERLLGSVGPVDSTHLRLGLLNPQDWRALTQAQMKLWQKPILLDDTPIPTLLDVRTRARRWRQCFEPDSLGLVIVDYLGLVATANDRGKSREREVAEISAGLKSLARELGVPVLALSQLNRGVEDRADKRPMLRDLRDSGAIEQDADMVMFLYRDEVYTKEASEKPGIAEIIVAKQRNGPIGTVEARWSKSFMRFDNLQYMPPPYKSDSYDKN